MPRRQGKTIGRWLASRGGVSDGRLCTRRALNKIERGVGAVTDALAAVLVVIEIALLFAGMASRYALHRPLVWTDELSGMLFLWLAMLGAAVALRRGAHMCMTAFVSSQPGGGPWRCPSAPMR